MKAEQANLPSFSPLAGKPATPDMLIDVAKLERDYFERRPDVNDPTQLVSFGTSGHRGSPFLATFTEAHILAITQSICEYRQAQGIDGPLFMGKDTHAISSAAQRSALEVLAANNVETVIQASDGVTPTPVISREILVHYHTRKDHFGDGIVVTLRTILLAMAASSTTPRMAVLQIPISLAGFRIVPTISSVPAISTSSACHSQLQFRPPPLIKRTSSSPT